MAQKLYASVNGVSKQAKKWHVFIDSQTKKVKKAYVSVGELSKKFWDVIKIVIGMFDNGISPIGVNWSATNKIYKVMPDYSGTWTFPAEMAQYVGTNTILSVCQSQAIPFVLSNDVIIINYPTNQGPCTIYTYIPIDRMDISEYSSVTFKITFRSISRAEPPYNFLFVGFANVSNNTFGEVIRLRETINRSSTRQEIEISYQINYQTYIDYITLGYCAVNGDIEKYEVIFD